VREAHLASVRVADERAVAEAAVRAVVERVAADWAAKAATAPVAVATVQRRPSSRRTLRRTQLPL
jgi:hypothetical protein